MLPPYSYAGKLDTSQVSQPEGDTSGAVAEGDVTADNLSAADVTAGDEWMIDSSSMAIDTDMDDWGYWWVRILFGNTKPLSRRIWRSGDLFQYFFFELFTPPHFVASYEL